MFTRSRHLNLLSSEGTAKPVLKLRKRTVKRSKRFINRYGILTANMMLIFAVGFFVWQSQTKAEDVVKTTRSSQSAVTPDTDGPIDSISAADIATNVAFATSLPQARSVSNFADSYKIQLSVVQSDESLVAKPQLITTDTETRKDIMLYTTKQGDTISKLAAAYNVTSDSIKWSNEIYGDNLEAGKQIVIPPRNSTGFVYKVKSGDTAKSLAERFTSSEDKIISFNDAEISGLPVGEYILIPNGTRPAAITNAASFASNGYFYGGPVYAGNGYDYGYCTWWAAKRRLETGRPMPSNWGGAFSWYAGAVAAGFRVDKTPEVGGIVQQGFGGGLWYTHHVAYIEEVLPDGTAIVSQMNVGGWAVVTEQRITPAEFQRFGIYVIH